MHLPRPAPSRIVVPGLALAMLVAPSRSDCGFAASTPQETNARCVASGNSATITCTRPSQWSNPVDGCGSGTPCGAGGQWTGRIVVEELDWPGRNDPVAGTPSSNQGQVAIQVSNHGGKLRDSQGSQLNNEFLEGACIELRTCWELACPASYSWNLGLYSTTYSRLVYSMHCECFELCPCTFTPPVGP